MDQPAAARRAPLPRWARVALGAAAVAGTVIAIQWRRNASTSDYLQACLNGEAPKRAVLYETTLEAGKRGGRTLQTHWLRNCGLHLQKKPMQLDATIANGCVKIVPGSQDKLLNPDSGAGFLNSDQIDQLVAEVEPEYLELKAGEGVLLHNWLLHSSEVNSTEIPRRAFSVCYMDAATVSQRGHQWPIVFGEGSLTRASIA